MKAEQLLELLHGEGAPRELEASLDHIDACPACAASFQVLVDLTAHSREALGALAVAPETSRTVPFPVRPPQWPRSWTLQYLPLAASVALAFLVGLVVSSTPVAPLSDATPDLQATFADLATDEFVVGSFPSPAGDELVRTSGQGDIERLNAALGLMGSGDYAGAASLLDEDRPEPRDPHFELHELYLGAARYLSDRPADALITLRRVDASVRSAIRRTALWYEANALIRLDRPQEALVLLERMIEEPPSSTTPSSWILQMDAENLADRLRKRLATPST